MVIGVLAPFYCAWVCAQNPPPAVPDSEENFRASIIVGIVRRAWWHANQQSDNLQRALTQERIHVCAVGESLSKKSFRTWPMEMKINQRQLVFFDLTSALVTHYCAVLIVGQSADPQVLSLHPQALTVCDNCDAKNLETAILLEEKRNRITFTVYLEALNRAGISLASDVLNAADKVIREKTNSN